MANVQKYTRGACGHLFKHFERAKDKDGNYIQFKNEQIDTSKSHLNYNLAEHDMRQGEVIHKRIQDGVRLMNRKDVNVMCSWVITQPTDFVGDSKDFFKATYEFMSQRYGKENVISAYVHLDEKTPHMHFAFCPIVPDLKRGGFKFHAKSVIDLKELNKFHSDLNKHLEEREMPCSILNESTKQGNKSIAELKRGTAINELNTILSQIDINNSVMKSLETQITAFKDSIMTIDEVNRIDLSKDFLGRFKCISEHDIKMLKATASRINEVELENRNLRTENNLLKKSQTLSLDEKLKSLQNEKELEHCKALLSILSDLQISQLEKRLVQNKSKKIIIGQHER